MTQIDYATLAIRGINLVLWLILGARILRSDRPVSGLARRITLLVIMLGMTALFLGSLTPYYLSPGTVRLIYTAFTSLSAIAATALLTTGEPNGRLMGDKRLDHPARWIGKRRK